MEIKIGTLLSDIKARSKVGVGPRGRGAGKARRIMEARFKLCVDHKLELWRKNYGPAEALSNVPTAHHNKNCSMCNGTWAVNNQLTLK